MAGYYLYTLIHEVFTQLTTSPTKNQGRVLAEYLHAFLEEEEWDLPAIWPTDRGGLAELIVHRLALPDWYSDLTYDEAQVWDEVVYSFEEEAGGIIGIDFQCPDYESICWDCAKIASAKGANLMDQAIFGHSGFRYFGKPTNDDAWIPMYSLFTHDQVKELLTQLLSVEARFASLPAGEGSPREQFFEGLLPSVRDAATRDRVLWVQTDT